MHCDLGDGEPSAYIFDASGCALDPNVRDLATLEVSSFLHHPRTRTESLIASCVAPYSTKSHNFNLNDGSDQATNTFKLISQIRAKAFEQEDPDGPIRQY